MRRLVAGCLALACGTACAQEVKPIRVWGYEGMRPLMERWEAKYAAEHPGVKFANVFHGAAAVPAGLYNNAADVVVMGREFWPVDSMAFHWVFQYAPFGVEVIATTPNAPTPSFTPVVIVNKANPMQAISVAQLDAVFGSEHTQAPANVRVWNDLAVSGALGRKTIVPVGFGEDEALGVFWRKRVLKDDYKPNAASVLLQGNDADVAIARRVAGNLAAIGYTSARGAKIVPGVKVIPVVDSQGHEERATVEDVGTGEYPLARGLQVYVNRKPGQRIDAGVESFVLWMLSDEAQREVRVSEGFASLSKARREKDEARVLGEWTTAATGAWKE